MRHALISDIHANLEALEVALNDIRAKSIERIYCLGDVVNYGANPNECLKLVRDAAPVIIRGNHEAALVSEEIASTFNPYARDALEWTREQLPEEDRRSLSRLPLTYAQGEWMLVHGTVEQPENFDYLFDAADASRNFRHFSGCRICFFGHTHVPLLFSEKNRQAFHLSPGKVELAREDRYIINVGSVGQPRDLDPRLGYMIFDDEDFSIEFVRLFYDYKVAARKILKMGLPSFLADRLGVGR